MREKEKKQERENFEFRQWHHRNSCCPNLLTEKPSVAMPLSKIGGKKIVVAEITCEELKKKKKVLHLQ